MRIWNSDGKASEVSDVVTADFGNPTEHCPGDLLRFESDNPHATTGAITETIMSSPRTRQPQSEAPYHNQSLTLLSVLFIATSGAFLLLLALFTLISFLKRRSSSFNVASRDAEAATKDDTNRPSSVELSGVE